MADKNLHDIKIDELDSPKKTPLKNILTLLALLVIILVISVVITKLILTTDEDSKIEDNVSNIELRNHTNENNVTKDEATSNNLTDTAVPTLNPIIMDKNLSSIIKAPLNTNQTPKEIATYKTPKKNNTDNEPSTIKKTATVKNEYTPPKRTYVPKQEVNDNTQSTVKKATYLGGKEIAVSRSYYIQVGAYLHTSNIIKQIKKNKFNYSLVKAENDTTLTRVLVGPFFSHNKASKQLDKVKANISTGAFITKEQ
ncbi:MAG: Unknown protein [uncultured Sulfurovum sp.]|uniref:SPOR domain-containing protein n=1 Tax=uncultured Sulfurovum sp. TaxID=269237 RepID=A0A6S6U604_9BACT|nr:MAG: Unknown protein [uncultured Sulfurovum sp.]